MANVGLTPRRNSLLAAAAPCIEDPKRFRVVARSAVVNRLRVNRLNILRAHKARVGSIPNPAPTSQERSLTSFLRDTFRSLRSWRRTPGAALLVIFALGLSGGALLTMVSLFNALLWRELPVSHPGFSDKRTRRWSRTRSARFSSC